MISEIPLWRWLMLAVLMAGVVAAWIWSLKRQGGLRFLVGQSGELRVKERVFFDAKTGVVLLNCRGCDYLVAFSPGGVAWQIIPIADSEEKAVVS